jgi:hypothetical protein
MATGLISGGPVSLIYGAIVAAIGSICSALSLAELASAYVKNEHQKVYLSLPLTLIDFQLSYSRWSISLRCPSVWPVRIKGQQLLRWFHHVRAPTPSYGLY